MSCITRVNKRVVLQVPQLEHRVYVALQTLHLVQSSVVKFAQLRAVTVMRDDPSEMIDLREQKVISLKRAPLAEL